MPLKYLNNVRESLKMPLINCRVELNFMWTRYCVLPIIGNHNNDASSSDIIFTIKDTKLHVPVVTVSAKDNRKLPKLFSKGF